MQHNDSHRYMDYAGFKVNSSMGRYRSYGSMIHRLRFVYLTKIIRKLIFKYKKSKVHRTQNMVNASYQENRQQLSHNQVNGGTPMQRNMDTCDTVVHKLITSVYEAINDYLNQKIAFSDLYSHYFILPSMAHTLAIHIEHMRQTFEDFRMKIVSLQLSFSQELFQLEEWRVLFKAISRVQYAYSGRNCEESVFIEKINRYYSGY